MPGALHDCARDVPVPGSATLVDTASAGSERGEARTCVVTMAFGSPTSAAADETISALTAAGWQVEVEHRGDHLTVLRTRRSRCATVLVLPARTALSADEADAVEGSGRPTVAVLSFHPCQTPAS